MKATDRSWVDVRGVRVAVPVCGGGSLRDRLRHSDALARFAARVGLNGYPGAGLYPPTTWVLDPLRGRPGWKRLRVRLLGGRPLPECLYRVRRDVGRGGKKSTRRT